jgi:UDP-N-acetyl-D-mannosaminuronate dehydrogenase
MGLSYKNFDNEVRESKSANIFNALQKCEQDLSNPKIPEDQKIISLKLSLILLEIYISQCVSAMWSAYIVIL